MNIYQKIALITGELGSIQKGGRNREQGYDFIEYAAVAGELRKLFAKHGVVIVPRMEPSGKQQREAVSSKAGKRGTYTHINFTYCVVNADDPNDKFTVQWTGEALDYGDKATNKAATSALKYYLMRQFNISEKGEDPDRESPEADAKETDAAHVKKVMDDDPLDFLREELAELLRTGLKKSPNEIRAAIGKLSTESELQDAIEKTKAKTGGK